MARLVPEDGLGLATRRLVVEGISRGHQRVLGSVLEQEGSGSGVPHVVKGLDWPHGLEPGFLPRFREAEQIAVGPIFRAGRVRYQAAIADNQYVGLEPILHTGQQAAHSTPVADPKVGEAAGVNFRTGEQHVDGSPQIHDQLDLLFPILLGKCQSLTSGILGPGEWRVDEDHDRTHLGHQGAGREHRPTIRRHTMHHDDARVGARAIGDKEGCRDSASLWTAVGEIVGCNPAAAPAAGFHDVERFLQIVFKKMAVRLKETVRVKLELDR